MRPRRGTPRFGTRHRCQDQIVKRIAVAEDTEGLGGPLPYPIAILLAERAIVEEGTHTTSLIALFDELSTPVLPVQRSISVYVKFTDAEGRYRLKLDMVHLPSDRVVGTVEVTEPVIVADRLQFYNW